MQFVATRRGRLEVAILWLVLTGMTLILIGSWKVRVAMTYAGDGPILYAHYFNNPERFRGDLLETYGHEQVWATAQNLIPAVSFSYLGIDPANTAWLLVYLQNVLLGAAVFRLAKVVTGRSDVAWLSVFFTYAATIWQWNLACYGNLMWSPYAGHLAAPFLIYAMSYAYQRRDMLVGVHLAIAATIHPTLAICTASILGLYWIVVGVALRAGVRRLMGQASLLALVVAFAVLPRLVLVGHGEHVTNAEMWDAIHLNAHFTPWEASWRWHRDLATVLGFGLLALLGLRRAAEPRGESFRFWAAILVGAVLLSIAHVVAWHLRMVDMVRLSPMRTTMVAVITCLPLVADYIMAKVRGDDVLGRWLVLVIVGFLAAYQYGALWLYLAALILVDLADGRLGPVCFAAPKALARATRSLAWAVAVGGTTIAVLAPGGGWWQRLQLDGVEPLARNRWLLIFGVAALVTVAADRRLWSAVADHLSPRDPMRASRWAEMRRSLIPREPAAIASWAVVLIIAVFAVNRCLEFGRQTREPRTLDLYAAQVWARNHTPTDAQFIIFDQPWRTETLRRVVIPRSLMWYIYHRHPSCKAYDDAYLDFFGFEEGLAGFTMLTFYGAQHDAYLALDAVGLRRFSRRFGGDYAVRWRGEPPLALPVAFNSDHVLVYALTADAADASIATTPPAHEGADPPAAELR